LGQGQRQRTPAHICAHRRNVVLHEVQLGREEIRTREPLEIDGCQCGFRRADAKPCLDRCQIGEPLHGAHRDGSILCEENAVERQQVATRSQYAGDDIYEGAGGN
jgi:hypothetical protein